MQETQVWSLGQEDPLEKEIATYSSILAWRIPGTEEPGGLPSMGSHRVGHDWSDLAAAAASILAWEIPWTEESGGLQSMGSQRVGHDWATELNWTELMGKTFMLLSMNFEIEQINNSVFHIYWWNNSIYIYYLIYNNYHFNIQITTWKLRNGKYIQ